MQQHRFEERAYGKVNLGLAVLTRRGDGFHELETLMVPIDVYDDVVVTVEAIQELAPGQPTVVLTGSTEGIPGAMPAPDGAGDAAPAGGADKTGVDALRWDETNLAYKAAMAYLDAYDATGISVTIQVTKRLPVAAGLGGGSSDAAAVLRALNAWDTATGPGGARVDQSQLATIALQLGSDVPFFLMQKASVARGRGERLSGVEVPPLHLVLVNPGIYISAGQAYAALVGYTPRLREGRAFQHLAEGLDPGWSNGLQPGVLKMHPELRVVLSELRGAELKGVLMSGSGSTCFGVAASAQAASEAAERLAADHPGWWVRVARTLGQGGDPDAAAP